VGPLVGEEVVDGEDLAVTDDQSGVGDQEVPEEPDVHGHILEHCFLVSDVLLGSSAERVAVLQVIHLDLLHVSVDHLEVERVPPVEVLLNLEC
jgi:hypothetical protein